jgi:endo-1,4-beta-xylanase
LLAALKNHITTIVGHYKGKVKEWDVVNEAICDWPVGWRTTSCGTQSIWQKVIGDDFIDSAFVWAHAADPDAELYYNDYGLEGGVTTSDKVKFLLTAVDKWVKNGIPITGVGSQTHVGVGNANGPANIRALAKALAKNGLTLQITELDIAFDQGTTLPSATQLQDQGHRYAQYMDVFLEEPNMKTFLIWGLTDKYSWLDTQTKIASALLYDRSYNKKPAYDSLVASLKRHAPSTVITPGVPPVVVEQKPYGASAISLPGKIEAENYDLGGEGVSYHDADAANSGNVYRTDGVDVTGDLGTGYKIDLILLPKYHFREEQHLWVENIVEAWHKTHSFWHLYFQVERRVKT